MDQAIDDTADVVAETPHGFRIELSLRLPRDRLSVPVVRHLTQDTLRDIGVSEADTHDIALALAEACANVLDHAGPSDAYDVDVVIRPSDCVVRVVNVGTAFDPSMTRSMASPEDETGRGVPLMHSLMDGVQVTSEPDRGTVVQLMKSLRFDADSPGRRLTT